MILESYQFKHLVRLETKFQQWSWRSKKSLRLPRAFDLYARLHRQNRLSSRSMWCCSDCTDIDKLARLTFVWSRAETLSSISRAWTHARYTTTILPLLPSIAGYDLCRYQLDAVYDVIPVRLALTAWEGHAWYYCCPCCFVRPEILKISRINASRAGAGQHATDGVFAVKPA